MKFSKLTLVSTLALVYGLVFSTSAFAQNTATPDVTQMSTEKLWSHLGKNVLRTTVACAVSSNALVFAALLEAIPVGSTIAGELTEIHAGEVGTSYKFSKETTSASAVGGASGAFVTDLWIWGEGMLFGTGVTLADIGKFQHTRTSFSATQSLAKHFYLDPAMGQNGGHCGRAGRAVSDSIDELIRRASY